MGEPNDSENINLGRKQEAPVNASDSCAILVQLDA
jgi:hypothetical protein